MPFNVGLSIPTQTIWCLQCRSTVLSVRQNLPSGNRSKVSYPYLPVKWYKPGLSNVIFFCRMYGKWGIVSAIGHRWAKHFFSTVKLDKRQLMFSLKWGRGRNGRVLSRNADVRFRGSQTLYVLFSHGANDLVMRRMGSILQKRRSFQP